MNFNIRRLDSYLIIWILTIAYAILGSMRLPWLILDFFSLYLIGRYLFLVSKNGKYFIYANAYYFIFSFLALLLLVNIIVNGIELITIVKLWDTLKSVPIFIYFTKLFKSNNFVFIKFYRKYYNFLTLLFIINHIMIFYQIYSEIEYDLATGTFGGESSHTIGFFWILLMLMQIKQKHDIRFLLAAFSSILLSILVDNNSAIYLIGGLIVYLGYIRFKKGEFVRILKLSVVSITTIVITVIFFITFLNKIAFTVGIGSLENYLNIRTMRAINIYIGKNKQVEDERLKILKKVYSINDTMFFGSGIGKGSEINDIKGSMYRKIDPHLMINEIGLLSYEIGFLGFIFLLIMYAYILSNSLGKTNVVIYFISFVVLLLFSLKCDWINDDRSCFFVFMIWAVGLYNIRSHYFMKSMATNLVIR